MTRFVRAFRIACALLFATIVLPVQAEVAPQLPLVAVGDVVPGRVVVGLSPDARPQTHAWATRVLSRMTTTIRHTTTIADGVLALDVAPAATARLMARLSADPMVAFVEPEYRMRIKRTPNDPLFSQQWALPKIEALAAWDTTTGADSVVIAVIDTGVYANHPDLAGRVLRGYDFVNNDANAADDNGHGTFTAGIIAGTGDNGVGIAGVCWACRILPVKVIDEYGDGSSTGIARGIRWAADQGAQIINMSVGGEQDAVVVRDAVAYAENRGVLVVAASGNEAEIGNPIEYPAAYESVLAVGATDPNDRWAPFSNFGKHVDVASPGTAIRSTTWLPSAAASYTTDDGTSAATPFVAGVAGLLVALDPTLRADRLRQVLMDTADDVGVPGRDEYFGAGRVNAQRAVEAVAATLPPPTIETITFPETGKSLGGEFRRFWEQNGGLPVFGFPTSDEVQEQTAEGTFTVQYFERNRFELHPELQPPYNVLLGRLGDTLLQRRGIDWQTQPKAQVQPECQYFAETGHNVCQPFLKYWQDHGLRDPQLSPAGRSLALFGLPLGEAQIETNSSGDTVVTQWFERARFEDHGPKGVLLGLLSNELQQLVPPPSPSPVVPPSVNAEVTPAQCVAVGTELQARVIGFAPGESVASWLTAPDGGVRPGVGALTAGPDGAVQIPLLTTGLTGGRWFWVFQGESSAHQALVNVHLY